MGMSWKSIDPPDEMPVMQSRQTAWFTSDVRLQDIAQQDSGRRQLNENAQHGKPRHHRWHAYEAFHEEVTQTDGQTGKHMTTLQPCQEDPYRRRDEQV